jgi:hypothetical protein
MTIAVFMIPSRGQSIVTITLAALIRSVAPGAALAFGLGGRDVASWMLVDAYGPSQERRGEVRRDAEAGRDPAQHRAQPAREQARAKGSAQTRGAYQA